MSELVRVGADVFMSREGYDKLVRDGNRSRLLLRELECNNALNYRAQLIWQRPLLTFVFLGSWFVGLSDVYSQGDMALYFVCWVSVLLLYVYLRMLPRNLSIRRKLIVERAEIITERLRGNPE